MDEEILQDFIVEAGEIIENLNEQLVQIEKTPDDKDLLNAIFRGFHTVKGGAGFLQLTSLVEVCHAAESLFDELRNGRISMSPDLMDAVLQAYDEITTMFDSVKNGDVPGEAPSELIDRLHALAQGSASAAPAQETPKEKPKPEPKEEPKVEPVAEEKAEAQDDSSIDDITEEEFEALLDQLHGKGHAPGADDAKDSNGDITDADFDKMLENVEEQTHAKEKQQKAHELKVASGEDYNKANEAAKATPAPKAESPKADAPKTPAKSENKGAEGKSAAEADTTVRVDTKVLDDIMNLVGELVLVRNRLVNMASRRADQEMSKAISNLDVVIRTDIISNCPKNVGIEMIVRSMGVNVIATDEIGGEKDIEAIKYAVLSGVNLVFTIHGSSIDDILRKKGIGDLIREGVFDVAVVLSNKKTPGTIEKIRELKILDNSLLNKKEVI